MSRKPFVDIIIAGAFMLVTFGAYGAWYHVVGKASADVSSLKAQIDERGAAGTRSAAARKALAELAGQESSVYSHLVSRGDIVSFLEGVQATGRKLGATVDVVSVNDVAGKPNQVSLALHISGPFDAVARTLGALEYQSYDATLSNVTLESQGASVGTWNAAAVFTVGTTPMNIPRAAPVVPVATTTASTTRATP